ncbi:MAG: hypothetical protein ACYCZ0_02825 [Minisyncoccota bacterium]
MHGHAHEKEGRVVGAVGMRTTFKKFRLAITTLAVVLILVAAKYFIHAFALEFLSINALFTSAIAGAIFIMGFLLAGIIADYKEAEKVPAEMRSSLENIWEEGKFFNRDKRDFNLAALRENMLIIIRDFIRGLGHEGDHYKLEPCVESVNKLSESFAHMEKLGMPPNYVVRLEGEQAALRKSVLRVYYIQRMTFLPSAHILAESLALGIVLLLLFVKTEGSPESTVLFGFISFLFLYIRQLITILNKPFRQGDDTMDDVSLFLLKEFEKKLLQSNGSTNYG